jgi:excisionase family DNA binding protein
LTVREAALALRCSEATIRRAIHAGRLHAFQLAEGGRLKIPVSAIEDILAPELIRPQTALGGDVRCPQSQ